jgi:hypothetical protein
VQLLDGVVDDLLGADGGGDEAPRRQIVLKALEPVCQPLRQARAGAAREVGGLLEVLHRKMLGRHDSGHRH